MTEFIYLWLGKLGYGHPIHSPATHIPMGMIMGGCLFVQLAAFLNKPAFYRTARHCYGFALAGIPPVMFLGYMDWQHFYHGAWRHEIVAKILLASILFFVCIFNFVRLGKDTSDRRITVGAALLSLAIAGAVGFFGGELVYGG